MKKTLLIIVLIGAYVIPSFSQSSQVVSAWNYIKSGEFENALTAINTAAQDEKTSTWPKTWYYRGVVYLSIYDDTVLRKSHPESLGEAIKSYKKAMELNPKNEFKDQIAVSLQDVRFEFL
jgi:tetratricopeptide (TPR) repeat protein